MLALTTRLALCCVAFIPLLFGLETVSRPARIMMHERRKGFCTGAVEPSDDEAFIVCDDCRIHVEHLTKILKYETDQSKKYRAAMSACHKFLSMFGYNPRARCPGLLSNYLEPIEFVIRADKLPDVCLLIGLCPENLDSELNDLDTLNLREKNMSYQQEYVVRGHEHHLKDKHVKDFGQPKVQEPLQSEQSSPNITFVQISDIHFDPDYSEGAFTGCLQVVCCHSLFGEERNDIDINDMTEIRLAGSFGDYNCDAPERTIRAILDFVLTLDPPPDFFVYAGDSSVHAILEQMEKKIEDNRAVTELLVEKLGHLGPIFPVFGNHETFPQSFYYRPMIFAQTILRSLSDEWPTMFNTTDEQVETIREHGYYVAEINPSLWILSFNSLYSYLVNLFALLSPFDGVWDKQRNFVRETLESARTQSAKVIFTSHMRPRYQGTYPEYADYLDDLVTEFSDVIILQLYGHDHDDSFLLHRDPNNSSRPVGTSLSAPSLTPFYDLRKGVNPAIRVFTLERDTWTPLDYTQYYVDLEEANSDGTLTMKLHYQFTEEYDLPDLSPASFASLSDRIHTDWTDFQKYERNFRILTNGRQQCLEDNIDCRRTLTCHTRTAKPREYSECLEGNDNTS